MDVIEMTRKLGEAIQQDPVYINYALAKEKNDADPQLQDLIGQFNLYRITLNEEFNKGDQKDDEKIKSVNEKVRECYSTIMENENMRNFNVAKAELDKLMQKVNGIIGLCVEGADPATCEPPEGCSGSCGTCGGCS